MLIQVILSEFSLQPDKYCFQKIKLLFLILIVFSTNQVNLNNAEVK